MATKIRNTNKLFHAPALPQPPITYSAVYEAQKDNVLKFYFANIDEALSKALQFDTSDIIDGSIPNSKLENSTVSFGGVTVSLGGSDATPAFNLIHSTGYPAGALTGTISGIQIAAGAVTESRLADDAVTTAKIADGAVNTDRLGTQAVTGAKIAANTIGSGNLNSGSVVTAAIADANVTTAKIADDAITQAKIADSAVNADRLASNAVTTAKITDANVTTAKIADANITTAKIADDAVTQAKIADNAIGSDQIASGAVIAGKLQTNAVTTSNIQTDAITTVKIADANVTTAKIADDTVTDAKLADSINSAITANTAKVTNATHTGEVTGATALTIADNVVDEANLKVSNAPVNGYFLSAQSGNTGGLTWAQVSSGISAVVDDTTPELGGNLDADNKDIHSVDQLSIGTSTLSHDFLISGYKTSEEGELFKMVNNNSSSSADGRMITFYASSNFRGSLGYTNVQYGSGTFFAGPGCGLLATTQFSTHIVQPCDEIGDYKDNAVDLGSSSARFDDIYATNSTIQTSDRNEKQNIAELSDAERRVAVAAKGLMRKFRWKDAVAEKGDNARIHFGIIAQDLEAAFTAEGLDAGKYAMFISTTWWEADVTQTDEDGVTKTKKEVYNEQAHIPEGVTATEVTRRGVRYPELLAFIIASL